MHRPQTAFTLIELIIVIAIIAIIAGFAISQYNQHIVKSRRQDGASALYDLANQLELYYAKQNTYQGARLDSEYSSQGFYHLNFFELSEQSFVIEATPLGSQAKLDLGCQKLRLNHLGETTSTGRDNARHCW